MEERVLPGRRVLLRPAPSFRGGSGLACAAIPPAPPSDVFQNRGTRCYLRRGLRPLHPACGGGREVAHRDAGHDCASVALSRDYITIATHATQSKVSFFSRGFGLACAAIPPAPPSNVFQNRGTRCYPRRGLRPLHPACGGWRRRRLPHLARREPFPTAPSSSPR